MILEKKLTKSTKLYKQKYPWLHWGGVCEKTENKTNLNCVQTLEFNSGKRVSRVNSVMQGTT